MLTTIYNRKIDKHILIRTINSGNPINNEYFNELNCSIIATCVNKMKSWQTQWWKKTKKQPPRSWTRYSLGTELQTDILPPNQPYKEPPVTYGETKFWSPDGTEFHHLLTALFFSFGILLMNAIFEKARSLCSYLYPFSFAVLSLRWEEKVFSIQLQICWDFAHDTRD